MSDVALMPDDMNEQGFRRAADLCRQRPGSRLVLPPGRHEITIPRAVADYESMMGGRLDTDTPWGRHDHPYAAGLLFQGCRDLTIEGQGCTLVFHGHCQPLGFHRCPGLNVRDLAIDYVRPPFSIFTIEDVRDQDVDLRPHDGYPLGGGEPVWHFSDLDPVTHRPGAAWGFRSASPLERLGGSDVFRTRIAWSNQPLAAGRWLLVQHIGVYRPGLHLWECDEVRLDGFTLHAQPGKGLVAHRCRDITIRGMVVAPSPGRLRSVNRDATHFISCRGLIDIADCRFDSQGDDAANVHGFYFRVLSRVDARTLRVIAGAVPQDRFPDYPDPGDAIEIARGDTLVPYAQNVVVDAHLDAATWDVTLRLADPLPDSFMETDVLCSASQVARLRFADNICRRNCARGVLVQTRGALIERNTFDGCTGTGVDVNTAAGWAESIGTRDVVIRDNRFINCGYGLGGNGDVAGIQVRAERKNQDGGAVHRDITIERNVIEGAARYGIRVSAAEGVQLAGNRVEGAEAAVRLHQPAALPGDSNTGV